MTETSTRTAWIRLSPTRVEMDTLAVFAKVVAAARLRWFASFGETVDDRSRHVTVIVRPRRLKKFYLDGKRVSRWHPFLRAARRNDYARAILKL